MASASKSVSFKEPPVSVTEVKKKKKYDSGTIGLAAARAFKAGDVYKIQDGEVILRPPMKTVHVTANTNTAATRSQTQSPEPPK